MLARLKEFVRGKLTHPDLDGEFNHYLTHINRLLLTNPLDRDLDFNGFLAVNFRARQIFEVVNAVEFSSIQEAIDSLGSTPGAVFIPPNTTFDESASITIPTDVALIGSGWTSIIRPAAALVGAPLITTADNSRCMLSNFKIDGNGVTTGAFPAVDATTTSGTDFRMENVWITGWGAGATPITTARHGVTTRGNSRARVTNCRFTSIRGSAVECGANGSSPAGFSQLVAQNEISTMFQHGILAWTGNNVKVVDNQITGTDFSGIFLDANVNGTHECIDISDNQIQDTGNAGTSDFLAGGIVYDATGGIATNLKIHRNQLHDIGLAAGAGDAGRGIFVNMSVGASTLDGCSIKNNQLNLVTRTGIIIINSDSTAILRNLSIDRNDVVDFASASAAFSGIQVTRNPGAGTESIKNIGIRGNTVGLTSGTFTNGIVVQDDAGLLTATGLITGNHVFGTLTGHTIRTTNCPLVAIGVNSIPGDDNPLYT